MCADQCRLADDYCDEGCDMKQNACVKKVQAQALQDYDKYTREQFAAHEAIELRPRDFERTASCDDARKSCGDDCKSHYQACYVSCGGKIETTSSCQYLCY